MSVAQPEKPAAAAEAKAEEQAAPGYINYWSTRWKEGNTGWQIEDVNPRLAEHVDLLSSGCSAGQTVFVPLCGQTHDLKFLLSRGYRVFGAEAVADCIGGLSERDGFKFTFKEEDSVYEAEDGRLRIYCGDLFECPIEKFGPFDAIWDRGSLVAVEYSQRKAYVEMIRRSLNLNVPDNTLKPVPFKYLLEVLEYDKTRFPGPPRSVDMNDMTELMGTWTTFQCLSKIPCAPDSRMQKRLPEGCQAYIAVYLLSST